MSGGHAAADGPLRPIPPPRRNPDLIGHDAAEQALLRAALSGRLPHAWLIGGPPGIGKATLAYRFARFVLSGAADSGGGLFGHQPESLRVDPEHPVFHRIASGGHADLLTIERVPSFGDGEGEAERKAPRDLPVEAIRRIAPFLRLTAAEGGWRVVIVDEAERMNRNGANALLKVLEEPPPRSLLLLVSANPGGLLPTIRSRCRRLDLVPLPESVVVDWLARLAPGDGPLAEIDRLALARLAEGSPGRALALVEEGGLDLYRRLIELLDGWPRLDRPALHRLGDQLAGAAAERAWRTVTGLLAWWLARLVRAVARGVIPPEVVAGEAELIRRLGAARGLDRWLDVWDKTTHLLAQADGANLDRKQVVLLAFLGFEAA